MITRIEIANKFTSINLISVYTIDKEFTQAQLTKIAAALANPVVQNASFRGLHKPSKFAFAIEVGFLPGVTDNVAATTREMIEDLLKIKFVNGENVYTSTLHLLTEKLSRAEADKIAAGMINPLIQRVHVKSYAQFLASRGMDKIVPRVALEQKAKVHEVNLNVADEELAAISRNGPLALDLLSMKTIKNYFKKLGRNPTDIELESIAQTWSEHCKHTIFSNPIDEIKEGLFKKYIRGATMKIMATRKHGKVMRHGNFCASVFTDNSGAIEFDKDFLVTHKVETHNSPSALDPFGGAVTGIVGVNRDAIGFGRGAKPIVNTFGFCFAPPKNKHELYRDKNLTQKMLAAHRIMDGVIAGVNNGGNCSGIPTPQGFMFFDDRFRGKPLVFVGTVGLIPKKINAKNSCEKKAQPGDYIVMLGGRVGQDGIHGATFSSEAMTSGSPATAVQIGDPVTQKKRNSSVLSGSSF